MSNIGYILEEDVSDQIYDLRKSIREELLKYEIGERLDCRYLTEVGNATNRLLYIPLMETIVTYKQIISNEYDRL